jgi:histidinol-phosphate aminotransferase
MSSAARMIDVCELAPSYVKAIAPYQPGKPISEVARELGLREENIVKLASNENPLGVSPRAMEAMRNALAEVARYPDGSGFELKAALSAHYRIEPSRIVLGNGSNDVLDLAARAFLSPSVSAVYSQHAFAVYPLATQSVGAKGIEVPAHAYGHDLTAMGAAVTENTRVVFIANPNNPTGTWLPPVEILAFLRKLPARVLVVLDEAYNEYLDPGLRADSLAWLDEFPNLVITRTFSKAYSLAGLRVGYAFAHPLVADLMNRVRQPFNVSNIAQAAAVAALGDREFVQKSFELNRDGMRQITQGLKTQGIDYIPSHGNFLCFRAGAAMQVYEKLLRLGVIVRPVGGYKMPEHLRVSIGLPGENERFLGALSRSLA